MLNTSKIIFTFAVLLSCVTTQTMQRTTKSYRSIKTVQNECFTILRQLDAQPKICHESNLGRTSTVKIKAVEARLDFCETIESLCLAIQKSEPEKAWTIRSFPASQITSANDTLMGSCLVKQLHKNYESTEYSCDGLLKQIKKIIQQATADWRVSAKSEYPDIHYTRSEKTHSLLVKEETIEEEIELFWSLINIMKLGDTVFCSNSWKSNSNHENLFYLWIKKESLKKIIKKLNLKIIQE